LISLDLETRDDSIGAGLGPGTRRGGYIVGIAVGVPDGGRWYFPMRHEYDPSSQNMPPEHVLRWAKDNLTRKNQPKVGANLLYDLDYLAQEGVQVEGPFLDVQIAEPLIDEVAHSYSLDALGIKYLGEGKRDDALYEWCAGAYGGQPTRKSQAKNIWRAPPELVGPYAEGDVDLPLRILVKQLEAIREQGLETIWSIESRLLPMLLAMRRRGVRVNVDGARELDVRLMLEAEKSRKLLAAEGMEPNQRDGIAAYCDRKGYSYGRTPTGMPQFQGAWLENHEDELLNKVQLVRKLEKHAGTFLQGYVLDHHINGRLHSEFNQLRSDEYGTVSGRFSSSNPNLQNIPSRDEELAPLVRSMWLPEPEEDWYSDDWSQIEYRLLVHYARGPGADDARQLYIDVPDTDFHIYASDLTELPRKPAKNINFGLVYGMGEPSLAARLGRTLEDARSIFEKYHSKLPFVKETFKAVSKTAEKRGYIHTTLGRRRRFHLYEPRAWTAVKQMREASEPALEHAAAVEKWGEDQIRRAYTHKALNGLLQGGAADIMKKAMVDIWEAGICDVLGAPLLTVHDELDWSVPRTKEAHEAHDAAVRIMETCVELRVPLRCDVECGPDWGHVQ